MAARRMHSQSGLSLAELLVALTVMAFVTGLATQGLWTGVRVWERGRSGATEQARLDLVRDYLRELIEQAYPLYRKSGRDGAVWFEGSADELVFLAPGPRRLPDEGMKRFRLHTAREAGARVLRLSWCARWGETPADPCRDDEHHVDLIGDFGALRFTYGAEEAGSWVNRKDLPGYLTIEMQGGESVDWRPLSIALRIDRDVTCRFDSVSRDCRGRS